MSTGTFTISDSAPASNTSDLYTADELNDDDEEFEKTKAMLQLMMELYDGRQSGEENGYSASSEVRERLRQRLAAKTI